MDGLFAMRIAGCVLVLASIALGLIQLLSNTKRNGSDLLWCILLCLLFGLGLIFAGLVSSS